MKADKKILIAFILNLSFSVFEVIGGVFTGSVAILSDALHDMGDAASIGIAYFLEGKSKRPPDSRYTYGYGRYSVLGGFITTAILLFGSLAVVAGAVRRIITPMEINYNGMIIFAVLGVIINLIAARVTNSGDSVNQKAVNLHILEDVLGWAVVLVGAVIMRFTDFSLIDPIMSIGVAIFILISAVKNLKEIVDIFLEKAPEKTDAEELKTHLMALEGVKDIHHIHLWTISGKGTYATMHIVCRGDFSSVKAKVREELREHGIVHSALETESENEHCEAKYCTIEETSHGGHHHH